MTVYLAIMSTETMEEVMGVFTSRRKAEKAIKEWVPKSWKEHGMTFHIDHRELDELF